MSCAAIDARSGGLSVALDNLLIVDVERRQSSDGAWHLTEVAAFHPDREGDATEVAVREYALPPAGGGEGGHSSACTAGRWDAAQARDAALVSASAEAKWMSGLSLAGVFEGEFSDRTRGYAGKGIVRYQW